jgi:hypothetical protein
MPFAPLQMSWSTNKREAATHEVSTFSMRGIGEIFFLPELKPYFYACFIFYAL